MTTRNMLVAVRGMHCPNCVAKVTRAFTSVPGVTGADVSLEEQSARVSYDAQQTEPDRVMQGFVDVFGNRFDLAVLES